MQQIDHAQIADAAYHLWLAEGRPQGRDYEHWLQARAALETKAAPKKRRATSPRAEAKAVKPATKKAAAKPKAAAAAKPKAAAKARKAAK